MTPTMPTAAELLPLLPELVLVGLWPKPLTDLMEPSIAQLAGQLAASKL